MPQASKSRIFHVYPYWPGAVPDPKRKHPDRTEEGVWGNLGGYTRNLREDQTVVFVPSKEFDQDFILEKLGGMVYNHAHIKFHKSIRKTPTWNLPNGGTEKIDKTVPYDLHDLSCQRLVAADLKDRDVLAVFLEFERIDEPRFDLSLLFKLRPEATVYIFHKPHETKWGVYEEGEEDGAHAVQLFESLADFEKSGNLVWQIEGISYQGEITGNVSLPKHYKSWLVMSKMRALLSGNDWMGHRVAKASRVNYFVPEVGRASVYHRLRAMQLDQYLDKTLFVRTAALGVPDIINAELLDACAGADVFMDTLIRFLDGPENNAEVIKEFAEKAFRVGAVARNVEINAHTQKSYATKEELGPEMFRGSGDVIAFLTNGYGLMQTNPVLGEVYVKCLFARELPNGGPPPFVLQAREEDGSSIIDAEHDFRLVTADAGTLSRHKAKDPKLKNASDKQIEKLNELHAQGMSLRKMAEALGVKSPATVSAWLEALGLKGKKEPLPQDPVEKLMGIPYEPYEEEK